MARHVHSPIVFIMAIVHQFVFALLLNVLICTFTENRYNSVFGNYQRLNVSASVEITPTTSVLKIDNNNTVQFEIMFSTTDCGYYWHRLYPFSRNNIFNIQSTTVDKITFVDNANILDYYVIRSFEQVFVVRRSSYGYTSDY